MILKRHLRLAAVTAAAGAVLLAGLAWFRATDLSASGPYPGDVAAAVIPAAAGGAVVGLVAWAIYTALAWIFGLD